MTADDVDQVPDPVTHTLAEDCERLSGPAVFS